MRKLAFLVAAAAAFGLWPAASRLGPVAGSVLLIALAAALAVAASGTASAIAAAGGALGAFAASVLAATSPAVAGAALFGLAYAERTARVRHATARLLHLGVAVGTGALAGALTTGYASASLAVRGVAVVVGAVLVALPLLVEAEDPVAHALEGAAARVGDPARTALREGAELRRTAESDLLDRKTARQVRRTWASLLRLADVRVRLERPRGRAAPDGSGAASTPSHAAAVTRMVDQRITEHVAALTRAFTAIDTAAAAEIGLDDAALRGVETMGESLEQVSRAIVEEV